MTRARRRLVRPTRLQDELHHLVTGQHAACTYAARDLAVVWERHRNEVWDEFDRTTVEGRGEFVPWGAVQFDGVPGTVRPPAYPYQHLERNP